MCTTEVEPVPAIFCRSPYLASFTCLLSAFPFNCRKASTNCPTPVAPSGLPFAFSPPEGFTGSLPPSLIEEYSGVAIGGTTISNELVGKPFLTYSSLIFAPLAEETGFRILPLGLLTFFLVRHRRKSSQAKANKDPGLASQIVQSFLVPGRFRRTNGIYSLTAMDWTFVAITAGLFGFAHVLFGLWSIGKILTAGIVGVALAVGFLKFGPYVDIPIHWVFNGVLTLYYVYSPLESATVLFALWLIATGIVSLLYMAAYLSRHGLRI